MSKLRVDILYAHNDDIFMLPEDQEAVLFGNVRVKGWARDDAEVREDRFCQEVMRINGLTSPTTTSIMEATS